MLEEAQTRKEARQSLLTYTKAVGIEDDPALHHRVMIEALQDIEDGKESRTMLFLPPGSAKSTYASILFPSHYMGRFKEQKVIQAGYEVGLASQFGRKVRNLTEQDAYKRIFPEAGLTQDSKARGEWELQNGSSYYACGVGSGVTGRRGDGAIIDDPIKGRKEADSELVRDTTWGWYLADLKTRLKPDAWIVLILTRWHEDDLAGRLLPDDWNGESGRFLCTDGEYWNVICIPAEARDNDILGRKPGEWLWTEWFSPEWWAKTKLSQPPRNWASLYQQIPAPAEGTFFQRDWFWRYDPKKVPEVRKYLSSDFAVTESEDADSTELGIHGTNSEDGVTKLYACLDGWGGKTEPDKWIDEYINLCLRHKPFAEFNEGGVIRRSIEGFLNKRRAARRAFGRTEWITPIGDKQARARALQGMASMGMVGLPNNEYGERVLSDLLKFPASADDHTVDMLSIFAQAIDQAHPAVLTTAPPKEERDAWDKAFDDNESSGWRV